MLPTTQVASAFAYGQTQSDMRNVMDAGPKPSRPRWQGLLVKAAIAAAAAAAIGFAVTHLRGQSSEAKAAALDDQMKARTALLLHLTASVAPFIDCVMQMHR